MQPSNSSCGSEEWRFPAGEVVNCTHCGVCVGVCPGGALDLDQRSIPYLARPGACTICRLCENVCPGREIDFNSLLRLSQVGEEPAGRYNPLLGPLRETLLAIDARPGAVALSSSGGAITALMRFALKSGRVDAVCGTAPDPRDPTRFVAALVTDPSDLEAGRQAKYQVIPVGALLRGVAPFRRVAFVGPGCQVAGVRKAQALIPDLRKKVAYVVGFFCSTANLDYGATEFMLRKGCGYDPAEVARLEFRHGPYPGAFRAERRGGGACLIPKDDYKWLYALYTERRCMACVDFTAELADISFGDPFGACTRPDGQSAGVVRTRRGAGLIEAALAAGEIDVETCEADRIVGAQKLQFAASRVVIPRRNRRSGRLKFRVPVDASGDSPLSSACGPLAVLFTVFRLRRVLRGFFRVMPFRVFVWASRRSKRS